MGNTLVIMAAGMGSRFGGIKQLEPVGPSGEIILDYSVYDAAKAGFEKVIFIIRKDIEEEFKKVIGNRLANHIKVEYVFQDLHNLPEGYCVPEGRTKPWGTGQAVLSCLGKVNEPFVVINADDYYGREGFEKINAFLSNPPASDKKYHFCMAGFRLGNTLSENGTVTRGVCEVDAEGKLVNIEETMDIRQEGDMAVSGDKKISLTQPVSMNMWGFTPDLLDELEKRFPKFLDSVEDGDLKKEYLLPEVVDCLIKSGEAEVTVLESKDKWFGVTYKEDKEYVVNSFKELVKAGKYPEQLFS